MIFSIFTPVRYFIIIASVLLLFACAKKPEYIGGLSGGASGSISTRAHGKMALNESYSGFSDGYAIESEDAVRWMSSPAPASATPEERKKAVERMVNYTGRIYMQSSQPEAVIDTVIQRAKEKGGTVSHRRNGYVSFQIPVAEFKSFFNYILTLGHITSKRISADDITDAFADNVERLRIAENTLARLKQLLTVAKSEQEKIALLKEIQRISEQIEQANLAVKELLRKAAFSTINLDVTNMPLPAPRYVHIEAFEWFNRCLDCPVGKGLKLKVPQNFIEVEKSSSRWRAASALNTVLWGFEIENEPQGSVDFWANAMLNSFKSKYKTELKTEDNFSYVRLETFDTEPMVYYLAILKKSDKKTLRIARAKFSNLEAEKKDSEAVKESLRRVK